MSEMVFDASAILALLNEEAGYKAVEPYLGQAIISTVNFSEVIAQLIKHGMDEAIALSALSGLGLRTVVFNEDMAFYAATLLKKAENIGLSLGDRACLALAVQLKLPVITADRIWNKLKLPIEIKVIR